MGMELALIGLVDIYIKQHLATKTLTLASVTNGQTLVINGLTFTAHTDTTLASARQYAISGSDSADAAALAGLINDATYGVPNVHAGVSNAVITLTSEWPISVTGEPATITEASVTNDPVSGNTASWSGWTRLQFQAEDGLKHDIPSEIVDIMCPEARGPVGAHLRSQEATIEFAIQQANLQMLQRAIPGSTYTAGATPGTNPNTLGVGGATSLTFYSVGFEGENRQGQTFVYFFPKCLATGPASRTYNHNGLTLVPFNFKGYLDLTRTAGEQLMKAWEITAAA